MLARIGNGGGQAHATSDLTPSPSASPTSLEPDPFTRRSAGRANLPDDDIVFFQAGQMILAL
jgi:hypothetical protein